MANFAVISDFQMEIKNSLGHKLDTLSKWKDGFLEVDKKPIHWKEGKSAYSLGYFFTTGIGKQWITELANSILGESLSISAAEIEHPSQLDGYRGGQRMQDLAIWGKTLSGKSCFIGIEAKVIEHFGDDCIYRAFKEAQIEHKHKPNSKKEDRIRELVEYLFDGKSPEDEEVQCLRYQLVHYFVGALKEAPTLKESNLELCPERPRADVVILPVLVFKTDVYQKHPTDAEMNQHDYLSFIKELHFKEEVIGDRTVYHRRFGSQEVYTLYEIQTL